MKKKRKPRNFKGKYTIIKPEKIGMKSPWQETAEYLKKKEESKKKTFTQHVMEKYAAMFNEEDEN